MAHKELVAKGALRYGTRMLQAGDPLFLDGPKARLFEALGLAEAPSVASAALAERARAAPPQLEHDADGKPGGSLKGDQSTRRKGEARRAKASK